MIPRAPKVRVFKGWVVPVVEEPMIKTYSMPYRCTNCDNEELIKYPLGTPSNPLARCSACGGETKKVLAVIRAKETGMEAEMSV